MTQIDTASAHQQTPIRLVRANHRRRELNDAMTDLERVVAGPSSATGWLDRVEAGLARVDEALRAHVEEVAGPDGLLAEILEVAPRLAGDARALEQEHESLDDAMERTNRSITTARRRPEPTSNAAVRRRVTTLLGRLTRHRQHGSDLVYEAYNVDISAAD